MKKFFVLCFGLLFVCIGSLYAANEVSKEDMQRIKEAMDAYAEISKFIDEQMKDCNDPEAYQEAVKRVIQKINTNKAIQNAPSDLKAKLDKLIPFLRECSDWVRNAPNWSGTQEEFEKKSQEIAAKGEQIDKEIIDYYKSCRVKKWIYRPGMFGIIFFLVIVVGGIFHMNKK